MGALIGLLFAGGVLLVLAGLRGRPDSLIRSDRMTAGIAAASNSNNTAKAGALGLVVGLLTLAVTGLAIAGLIAAVGTARVPHMWRARKLRQRKEERRAAWPDVIDSLVSAVRAGMSLPESVCAIADRGPLCIRDEFSRFAADYRATGRFEVCVLRLRDDLEDPVADRIIEALLAAREVGGSDLGNMLRSLAEFVRQDIRLRGEVEARRSWTVNGARLAVAAPWLVLLMLSTRPGTVAAYASVGGGVVLVTCALVSVGAYQLMAYIGRLPTERRIVA